MVVETADTAALETTEEAYILQSKGKKGGTSHKPPQKYDRSCGKVANREDVIRVANMKEFFETTEFGQELKQYVRKTSEQFHGQSVYEVTEDLPQYGLKRGNKIYLDPKHTDHLEIFTKNNKPRGVINLDGYQNDPKTKDAINQHRTIK